MRISSGLMAVVLMGLAAPVAPEQAARPDLSGSWRFDPAQSEDGRAKMRALRGDRGQAVPAAVEDVPGGGGRPMGGGSGGGRGGPGGGSGAMPCARPCASCSTPRPR